MMSLLRVIGFIACILIGAIGFEGARLTALIPGSGIQVAAASGGLASGRIQATLNSTVESQPIDVQWNACAPWSVTRCITIESDGWQGTAQIHPGFDGIRIDAVRVWFDRLMPGSWVPMPVQPEVIDGQAEVRSLHWPFFEQALYIEGASGTVQVQMPSANAVSRWSFSLQPGSAERAVMLVQDETTQTEWSELIDMGRRLHVE